MYGVSAESMPIHPLCCLARHNILRLEAGGSYIYDMFGKFPGTVDTMRLMWFMHVHHLDLDVYDRFFKIGAYGNTHAAHMAPWHS